MRRLDQVLSSLGYCSRREAREWIADERILVNGKPIKDHGMKIRGDEVLVDDEPLDHPEGLLLLLNKPLGLVCSHDGREGPSVYTLLPRRWCQRNPVITSIGRLDKDTTGLILLTDQTELVHRLTSPKHKVEKVYVATLDRELSAERCAELATLFASGTLLLKDEDTPCAPARLAQRGPNIVELVLTEGRYHQVRRMFASQDFTVTALHRESFGHLKLGDLALGSYQELPLDTFAPKAG